MLPVAIQARSVKKADPAKNAEFVSGTAKKIPANTIGSLDANSATELRFQYGRSVFNLPYQNITNTEVVEPAGHHLWKVPVPHIGKSGRFLSISYKDGDAAEMMTFRTSQQEAETLAKAIKERCAGPETAGMKPAEVKVNSMKPENWWGDRYWKTTHNKDKWPSTEHGPEAPGVPGGTK